MTSRRMSLIVLAVAFVTVFHAGGSAQTKTEAVSVDLCRMIASPNDYKAMTVSVRGVLSPGEHLLALYSPSCEPKAGVNLLIEAVLPPMWESLQRGKDLRKLLQKGKSASVELIGVFESGDSPYGPEAAKFRFMIQEISWVKKVPSSRP